MTDFRLALYNWRCENHLSQDDAAKRLGVSHAAVAQWETGGRHPRQETLDRIAPIIGYTPAGDPGEAEETKPLPPFTERLEAQRRAERAERLDAYMARNREQESPEPESPVLTNATREKLTRLAGFLEGLQCALKLDLSEQINTLNEIVKEV